MNTTVWNKLYAYQVDIGYSYFKLFANKFKKYLVVIQNFCKSIFVLMVLHDVYIA